MYEKMILLAAIASITLASCVKNEMEVVDNDDQEITFQTVTGNTGRAAIIGSNYPVDASFGTWARYTSVDWDYDVPSQEYITNKKLHFRLRTGKLTVQSITGQKMESYLSFLILLSGLTEGWIILMIRG